MYSELNIDVLEGLMDAPKPKQLYFGDKTKNCLELDITKCRRRALERSYSDFPEACVLDNIQEFTGQDFDFAYVDAGPPDMTDFQNFCFYNGPRWYHVELFYECKHFETVNAKGVKIGNEHIVCILKHLTIGLEIRLHLCTNEWKMLLGNAKELPIQTKPKQNG